MTEIVNSYACRDILPEIYVTIKDHPDEYYKELCFDNEGLKVRDSSRLLGKNKFISVPREEYEHIIEEYELTPKRLDKIKNKLNRNIIAYLSEKASENEEKHNKKNK